MARYFRHRFVLLVLCSLLVACGGGGGGGGSSSGTGGSPFVGNASPAVLNEQNALEIATSAYQGGIFGDQVYLPFFSSSSNTEKVGVLSSSFPMIFSASVHEVFAKITLSYSETRSLNSVSPLYTEGPVTIPDPFGIGSITYTFTMDETTYNFSGSIQYDNYHVTSDAYFHGTINISGSSNSNFQFVSYTISSNSFTFVYGNEVNTILNFRYTGAITYNGYVPTSYSITVSYYWQDGITGKVSWVDDYTITETFIYDGYTYPIAYELTISGKYYHPIYGYVVITTVQPFRYDYFSWYPSQGVILCTGANNSSIKLTATGGDNFLLEVDSGGDGIYEYQEIVYWYYVY